MASASTASLNARRKSCDTVCSSNSSCVFHKRKTVHPFATSVRPYVFRNTKNTVTQRVLSARLLKLRSLQTQLNDANFHLSELQRENQALKTLQTRQDKALSKYEGRNADLPKLLQSHEQEIRVLTTKNKSLKKHLKEVMETQKQKEEEMLVMRDQIKSLTQLSKNKNLGERQALTDEIEELKVRLKGSDEKITLLNRKLLLETKNYKHRVNAEVMKTKEVQKELSHAMNEIDRLSTLIMEGGKNGRALLNPQKKRFSSLNQKGIGSLTSLASDNLVKEGKADKILEKSISDTTLSSECVKEIPDDLQEDKQAEMYTPEKEIKVSFASEVMIAPSENIKARLSAKLKRDTDNLADLNQSFEKVTVSEIKNSKSQQMNVTHKLEKLSINVAKEDHIVESIGSCCKDMKNMVKGYASVVDRHKEDFQSVQSETEKLLSSLRETDAMNSKLRYTNFLAGDDDFKIPENDIDLAQEIWKEEFAFRRSMSASKELQNSNNDVVIKADRNGNLVKKEVKTGLENKHKLLATLRAIDNGDDVEGIAFTAGNRKRHLKQLDNAIDN